MLNNKVLKSGIAVCVLASLIFGILLTPRSVGANPIFTANTFQTSSATGSPSFLVPGVSTTTLSVDHYTQTFNGGLQFQPNRGTLLIRATGSSTLAVFTIRREYSNDGIDWYRDFLFDPLSQGQASSTPTLTIQNPTSFVMPAASSTVGGVAQTATNGLQTTATISVPTPTRFVRFVASII